MVEFSMETILKLFSGLNNTYYSTKYLLDSAIQAKQNYEYFKLRFTSISKKTLEVYYIAAFLFREVERNPRFCIILSTLKLLIYY